MTGSLTGFSKAEEAIVREFLRSCTVPLVREIGDKLALMGTGTFFDLEGELWLVTASHVIAGEEDLRELAIPMRTTDQFLTLGNCTLYRPDTSQLDVAIVLIQGEEFQKLAPQNWRILNENNIARYNPAVTGYIIPGYPREILAKNQLDWPNSFTRIYTTPIHGSVEDADHPVLRLVYARSAMNDAGATVETPHLEGISGTSVWAVKAADGLWAPEKILKVVAVEVSFKHDEYITGEWWTLVRELLRRWKAGQFRSAGGVT
jgi:hypothetical protein